MIGTQHIRQGLLIGLVVGALSCREANAQDAAPPSVEPTSIAALVGDEPIMAGEVLAELERTLGGREIAGTGLALLQARMLEQFVARRAVLIHLERDGQGASDTHIEHGLEQLRKRLAAQKESLEALLKKQSISEKQLRRQVAWELTWKKDLEENRTDAALEQFFHENKRHYDGSEVAASHILLRPAQSGDPAAVPKLVSQAERLREEIENGEVTFEEAAKKYSAGPSRRDGGKLGYFPREGVMDEAFSETAFALEVGEISQPVRTRFGVHLIRTTAVREGGKKWTDVRDRLAADWEKQRFQRLAGKARAAIPVRYTGAMPYLKPGTTQVIVPQSP